MNWKPIFGYLSSDYRSWPSYLQAEQQVITLTLDGGGASLRLVLENEYGIESLIFTEVTLSHQGEVYLVQVLRQDTICVRPGERIQTDPIAVMFEAGDQIVITTQLAKPTIITSGIVTYSDQNISVKNSYQNQVEPQEKRFRTRQENPALQFVYGFQYLEAVTDAKTIHFFGDSLTQQGWLMDGLKNRLREEQTDSFGFVNLGIGGNQILVGTDQPASDAYLRHGVSGLLRFERDVFSLAVPDTVLLYHGINDCLFGTASAEVIISGLIHYADIVKRYGSRLVACTLTPAGKSDFYHPLFETKRQAVNAWIRETSLFDSVLDLDFLARDAVSQVKLADEVDRGDGLHYSRAGGHLLAQGLPRVTLLKILGE
ncbi:GDSL-type esterase/lipase family protein [Lactococcus piscium]|uniref:SGNH family lipase/esterase n=1 Tax=Pseudolactococcus piscium MKFS47 TaxID=297352 RepID=A0A0D6DVA0_9LACT|nr:GDSL-type esterase/lipase family protein [Lactococcus piscium]CEN27877.1 SGNH family lipase/esterase [Lactococcus piscium MKFS47]